MGREDQGEEPSSAHVRPQVGGAGGDATDDAVSGIGAPGDGAPELDPLDLDPHDVEATLPPESGTVAGRSGATPPTVVVEGYDQIELIGRGGFATVWRARQITMDRVVALKVMDHHLTDDEAVRRFGLESTALVELSWNPNIVHVYDAGVTADDRPFLAMEYLPAGTLGDRVRSDGALPPAEVRRIGLALTDAVGAAHDAGVLHRDLKPDNVLLGRRDEPKLADFGIARVAGEAATSTSSSQAFRGTILHAAPELLDGEQPSEASDVWSIGSTLYTLCTGRAPFARTTEGDDSVTAIIRRTLLEEPPALPDDVPPDLAAVVRACLAKDPADRPATAARVHELLAATVIAPVGGPTDAPGAVGPATGTDPAAGSGSGRRPVLLAVAAIVAVLVVAGAVVLLGGGGDADPTAAASDPGDDTEQGASPDEPSTTDAGTPELDPEERAQILERADGASELRPLAAAGLADTSPTLRDRLNRFVASTTSSAVRSATRHDEISGETLGFGPLPARMDYTAVNKYPNDACRKLFLEDQVVLGAAGGIWTDGSHGVLVNAIQLDSPEAARQYYWATAMYHGMRGDECSGWPADGLAIAPDDLVVDRREFAVDAEPDDLLTAIANDEYVGRIAMALAYQSVSLIGDTVLIASVGTSAAEDPAALTATISEAIAAFTD